MNALREAGSPKIWWPALALVIAVVAVPVLVSIVLSLLYTGKASVELSITAYRRLIRGPELESIGHIFRRGLMVASLSALISFPVGFYIATRQKLVLRLFLLGLMLAPFFSSDVIRAYSWSRILAADGLLFRLLSAALYFVHIDSLRFSEAAVTIALCSAVLPFGIISIVASLPGGDNDFWLASRDLGVSSLWEFWRLAFPVAVPGLAVGWILQLILASFSSVEEQYLGNSTSMQKISSGMINSDLGSGSLVFFAISTIVVALLLGSLLVTGWFVHQRSSVAAGVAALWEWSAGIVGMLAMGLTSHGRHRRWGDVSFLSFLLILTSIAFLVVLAPIGVAMTLAFRGVSGGSEIWTIDNFRYLFDHGSVLSALGRSLVMAFLVGGVCTILAVLLSTVWWGRTRWKVVIMFAVVLGALLPAETYSLSALWIVRHLGIGSGGIWLAGIGQMAWALPFAMGAVLIAYQRLDISLLEGEWEFGGDAWSILWRVVIRSTVPAILGAAFFGFLLSLNEYSRGQYLGGGAEFLSTRVFGRMQSGSVGSGREIFAMSGCLVGLSLAACLLVVLPSALALVQKTDRP